MKNLKGVISYRLNYVPSHPTVYRQVLRINNYTFNKIKEEIKNKLNVGLEYGDCLELPIIYKNKNICFGGLNLSTARFIKTLMDEPTQKRFLMDRNSFLVVDL